MDAASMRAAAVVAVAAVAESTEDMESCLQARLQGWMLGKALLQ
jgi:hypothetical protein